MPKGHPCGLAKLLLPTVPQEPRYVHAGTTFIIDSI
jgi:hypothetical protein